MKQGRRKLKEGKEEISTEICNENHLQERERSEEEEEGRELFEEVKVG